MDLFDKKYVLSALAIIVGLATAFQLTTDPIYFDGGDKAIYWGDIDNYQVHQGEPEKGNFQIQGENVSYTSYKCGHPRHDYNLVINHRNGTFDKCVNEDAFKEAKSIARTSPEWNLVEGVASRGWNEGHWKTFDKDDVKSLPLGFKYINHIYTGEGSIGIIVEKQVIKGDVDSDFSE